MHARVLAEQARADADRSKAEHMTGLAQAETQVLQQVERSVEAEKKAFSRAQRWVREVKVRDTILTEGRVARPSLRCVVVAVGAVIPPGRGGG